MDTTYLKKVRFYNWYLDTAGSGHALPDNALSGDAFMCEGKFWDLDGNTLNLPKVQEYDIIDDEPEAPEWFLKL